MTIVVTGATGNVGRPLVAALAAAGASVRAVTRAPETAGLPPSVEPVGSAAGALSGASAVFLNSRALGEDLETLVAQCVRAGVTKLVALSAINADDDLSRQPSRFRGDRNKEVEQLAVDSGLAWVSLRPTVFATNFAGMWSPQIRAGDVVSGHTPRLRRRRSSRPTSRRWRRGRCSPMTSSEQRVPLTGPQAFTNSELVEAIGAVLDRPLQYREIPNAAVRQRFLGLGFPADFADAYIAMLAATLDTPALVTHDVEKILGRRALPFAQWVAEHRDVFARAK